MNLNVTNPFVNEHLPSHRSVTTDEIFWTWDVNGAAIEASASDRLSPTSAVLSALQSLAPSPHIPTIWKSLVVAWICSTRNAFYSGLILAKTHPLWITFLSTQKSKSSTDVQRCSKASPVNAISYGYERKAQGGIYSFWLPNLLTSSRSGLIYEFSDSSWSISTYLIFFNLAQSLTAFYSVSISQSSSSLLSLRY